MTKDQRSGFVGVQSAQMSSEIDRNLISLACRSLQNSAELSVPKHKSADRNV